MSMVDIDSGSIGIGLTGESIDDHPSVRLRPLQLFRRVTQGSALYPNSGASPSQPRRLKERSCCERVDIPSRLALPWTENVRFCYAQLSTEEDLMSWMPSNDPVLGDPKSCDALELVIVPRTRDLGDGFQVRRALPHGQRQMVGPFIFFDHFGPVQFLSGAGMDVRPHPHIGLATVTYLFDGKILHRDSEGHIQEIEPGAMNLMTAGRGIAHSERTPELERRAGQNMLGLQSWIALPAGKEEIAPSFQHYAAGDLPMIAERGFTARIIAGSSFGITSPVEMLSPWFYTEVSAEAGVNVPLDPDHEERAIYLVDGEIEIAHDRYQGPRLLIFRPGDAITVTALRPTRMMFLGGDALEGPRHIWWNFVSSSKERIEQAKQDWKTGKFAPVPEEREFIPLPE
jgi:redox-sensitive bicupin YhaK (pirin superfamily)